MKWVKFTFFLMSYRFINNQHSIEICKAAIGALGVLTNGNYLNLFSCLVVTRRFTDYYPNLDCRSFNRFPQAIYD